MWKKSFMRKKSGAALAYVIVASMFLLIVATVLISSASYNLKISAKSSQSRQAYVTARSAVEFAKSEIYKRAGDETSTISNGKPTDSFFVKKSGPNDFSIVTDVTKKPTEKDYAGECSFKLKKAVTTTIHTTTVWIDGEEIAQYPDDGSLWNASDKVQTQTQTIEYNLKDNTIISDILSLTFKEFPTNAVDSSHAVTVQIKDTKSTEYTYDTTISAEVEYSGSKRSQKINYALDVIPGYTEKVSIKDPENRPGDTTLPQWTIAGNIYGKVELINGHYDNPYTNPEVGRDDDDDRESSYPFLVPRPLFANNTKDTVRIIAPQVYLMGGKGTGSDPLNASVYGHGFEVEFETDFIYFNGDIENLNNNNPSLRLYNRDDKKNNVIAYFNGKDGRVRVIKNADNPSDHYDIPNGYYIVTSDTNLFTFTAENYQNSMTLVTKEELEKSPYKEEYDLNFFTQKSIEERYKDMISGDVWSYNGGCQWTNKGEIAGNKAKPSYKIRSEDIENSSPEKGVIYGSNNVSGSYEYPFTKHVGLYINDTTDWQKVLEGEASTYKIVDNVYRAKSITMQFVPDDEGVGADKFNFVVPAYKTVVFKADEVVLNTQYKDTEIGSMSDKPMITHEDTDGSFAAFVVESISGTGDMDLIFPTDTIIKYHDFETGEVNAHYTAKAGKYKVTGGRLNLFSDEAKTLLTSQSGGGGIPSIPFVPTEQPGESETEKPADFFNGIYS